MKKNGKNIRCKKCKKEFYISGCMIGTKKYCSMKCYLADNMGFKPRNKPCVICGKKFLVKIQIRMSKKTCGEECHKILAKQITIRAYQRMRQTIVKYNCKGCKRDFDGTRYIKRVYCSDECRNSHYSKIRLGKGNPAYTNGKWAKKNNPHQVLYDGKHMRACKKYRKWFLEKNSYEFCEVCKKSNAFVYNTHHIYYASRYPKHPQLHNFRNLIFVCIQCHNDFHSGKLNQKFLELEKERGLKELFGLVLEKR